jgi:membrane-bound lytic murein transglycosylase D
MNSTSALQPLWRLLAPLVLALTAAAPGFAADNPIPRPAGLERDVQFWIRVYTEVNTDGGFLHDERHLGVVYEAMQFAPNTSPRERQKSIDDTRDRYIAALRRIASASGDLPAEDQRIRELWGAEGTPTRLLEATKEIRFQLGQSDRFREGLVRAGAWEAHIAEVFANRGLPAELAALPHVESSFNPAAYSKVGAAGLWQFMRSTGRRYMRIDNSVDDRMDPFRSTDAAAQLLAYNYRVLGSWPLALTAYNHGAAGMRRAKLAQGTDDIETIVRKHRSPSFGFASRNFYVSFLAALEIDKNPQKYFGDIEVQSEVKFQEITLPAYVPMSALQRAVNVSRERLRALNPALRPAVWEGQRHVPKGYRLRLPADGEKWTAELLTQRLSPGEVYAGQPAERSHRVGSGETLASIAKEYGVSVRALADANGMRASSMLRAGRQLVIPPSSGGVLVASTPSSSPPAAVAPAATPAPQPPLGDVYVVRRGDALSEIAKKVGLTEAEILKINKIRNPNFIFEGQRLALKTAPAAPASPPRTVVASASPATTSPVRAASPPPPTGAVPQAVAQRESAEDAEAIATVGKPAARSEPVSAAQAEAIGPAVGPGVETPQSADPNDYSAGADATIVVLADETLGHYADWLGVSAQRLRTLNKMKYGHPVLIGRRVKLDFAKTTAEEFEKRRREYHSGLQAGYFAAHRIIGTEVYIARRGDSLWTVTQRYTRLPVWLLQQYNPDVDLSEMRAGTEIVVPRVEEVVTAGG